MEIPRWLWIKTYFDRGLGLTNYFKYVLALIGAYAWTEQISLKYVIFLALIYFVVCIFIGWFWVHSKLVEKENEINNLINPFQKEVREKLQENLKKMNK